LPLVLTRDCCRARTPSLGIAFLPALVLDAGLRLATPSTSFRRLSQGTGARLRSGLRRRLGPVTNILKGEPCRPQDASAAYGDRLQCQRFLSSREQRGAPVASVAPPLGARQQVRSKREIGSVVGPDRSRLCGYASSSWRVAWPKPSREPSPSSWGACPLSSDTLAASGVRKRAVLAVD
jgi:hypothetical protein